MKLYKVIWTHNHTRQRVIYWHPIGHDAEYHGRFYAEGKLGLSKYQETEVGSVVVNEVNVPADSPEKLAAWLNVQLGESIL